MTCAATGDYNSHVSFGVTYAKEVTTVTQESLSFPNFSIISLRRGYWENKIAKPRKAPCKVTDHCGPVLNCIIPAPRGTAIISAPVPKKY